MKEASCIIEQTRFLSTVFLCSGFKLVREYFVLIFICGNLSLRIAEKIANISKILIGFIKSCAPTSG